MLCVEALYHTSYICRYGIYIYVESKGFLVLFLVTDRQAYSTSGQVATGGKERKTSWQSLCLPQCRPAQEREREREGPREREKEVDQKMRSASYCGSAPLASTDAVLNFGIFCTSRDCVFPSSDQL